MAKKVVFQKVINDLLNEGYTEGDIAWYTDISRQRINQLKKGHILEPRYNDGMKLVTMLEEAREAV